MTGSSFVRFVSGFRTWIIFVSQQQHPESEPDYSLFYTSSAHNDPMHM